MDQTYASVDPSRKLPTNPMSVCGCDADLLQTISCQGTIVYVIQGGFFSPLSIWQKSNNNTSVYSTQKHWTLTKRNVVSFRARQTHSLLSWMPKQKSRRHFWNRIYFTAFKADSYAPLFVEYLIVWKYKKQETHTHTHHFSLIPSRPQNICEAPLPPYGNRHPVWD